MDPITELLRFWTPLAVVTAAVSGVAMALVITHLRPTVDTRLTSFLAFVLGVLWYAPQVIQRFADPAALEHAGLRTIGTFGLYMLGFAVPFALTLTLHRRHRQ